jgi:hypothetical protein
MGESSSHVLDAQLPEIAGGDARFAGGAAHPGPPGHDCNLETRLSQFWARCSMDRAVHAAAAQAALVGGVHQRVADELGDVALLDD